MNDSVPSILHAPENGDESHPDSQSSEYIAQTEETDRKNQFSQLELQQQLLEEIEDENIRIEAVGILDNVEGLAFSWPEGIEPPESARELEIFNRESDTDHVLNSFDDMFYQQTLFLINKHLKAYPIAEGNNNYSHKIEEKRWLSELREIPNSISRAKIDYLQYTAIVNPILEDAVGKINEVANKELKDGTYHGEVVLGNGADPILWALRANRWKTRLSETDKLIELDIGRAFLEHSSKYGYSPVISEDQADSVRAILEQEGVRPDSHFIDTGLYGSIAAAMIELLDPNGEIVLPDSVNSRISLIQVARPKSVSFFSLADIFGTGGGSAVRKTEGIRVLGPDTSDMMVLKIIDDGPKSTESPQDIIEFENGYVTEEVVYTEVGTQIRAYAAKQAVTRHFLPNRMGSIGPLNIVTDPTRKIGIEFDMASRRN